MTDNGEAALEAGSRVVTRLASFAMEWPAARIRVSLVPVQIPDETRADVALLERMMARDQRALAELYDRHARLLFGLLLRILRSRSDAEEVLQEVFVQAWTRTDTYNVSLGSPAGWLIGIARNRAIDRLRNNAVRSRTAEQAPPPPAVETPEARAAATERQRDVSRALASLPLEQRELIEHAYFEGLTQSELADRFKLPLGTVKTRVRTGLSTLRSLLQRTLLEL
jgi:RNA polymerase sigma-70 factor (ECF subfamily)